METLSGREASLGVAMAMTVMSLGSKSDCKSHSGTALHQEGCKERGRGCCVKGSALETGLLDHMATLPLAL